MMPTDTTARRCWVVIRDESEYKDRCPVPVAVYTDPARAWQRAERENAAAIGSNEPASFRVDAAEIVDPFSSGWPDPGLRDALTVMVEAARTAAERTAALGRAAEQTARATALARALAVVDAAASRDAMREGLAVLLAAAREGSAALLAAARVMLPSPETTRVQLRSWAAERAMRDAWRVATGEEPPAEEVDVLVRAAVRKDPR